jgi:hypothetical protein
MAYDDSPYKPGTQVVMLWKVNAQCIFVDIISIGMDGNTGIPMGMSRLLDISLLNVSQVLSFTLHLGK